MRTILSFMDKRSLFFSFFESKENVIYLLRDGLEWECFYFVWRVLRATQYKQTAVQMRINISRI